MRGDRFKRRLPRFIGKIGDMDDLFYAEDQEFGRIDLLLKDFLSGLYVSTIGETSNPDFFLRKLERDYGLESAGSINERINAILLKMKAKRTTTEEVILEICESFGTPAKFYPDYAKYQFYLDLWANGGIDLEHLDSALREVIPAHLDYMVRLNFGKTLVLETRFGDDSYLQFLCGEHPCGDIPYPWAVGEAYHVGLGLRTGQIDSLNHYGYTSDGYRAGELRDDGSDVEILYIQNFDRDDVYDFGGDL